MIAKIKNSLPHHIASNYSSHGSQPETTQWKPTWVQGQVPRQRRIFSKILVPNNLHEYNNSYSLQIGWNTMILRRKEILAVFPVAGVGISTQVNPRRLKEKRESAMSYLKPSIFNSLKTLPSTSDIWQAIPKLNFILNPLVGCIVWIIVIGNAPLIYSKTLPGF